jgi:hypothetical protein
MNTNPETNINITVNPLVPENAVRIEHMHVDNYNHAKYVVQFYNGIGWINMKKFNNKKNCFEDALFNTMIKARRFLKKILIGNNLPTDILGDEV